MAARYLTVTETNSAWTFKVHLDVARINSHRQPDSAWVIERTYLKDMPLEQVEKELARIVQHEIARRRSPLVGLSAEEARLHPLSGKMV